MNELVDELLVNIFSYFNADTLLTCSCVNKKWNRISRTQKLWRCCVLHKWPSQQWLYGKAVLHELNWYKAYQDLLQYSWYSPDEMKYFVSCNTIEDELISPSLRTAMLLKIESISKKWLQVSMLDHDGNMVSKYFNQNMELFFNTQLLQWLFLDKRRGYMDDLFSYKTRNRKQNNRSFYIRPYQVIPSCLVMYRWLSIFRAIATSETGLTFYRIWRFRLKHLETGLIFELCDWKAAMSSTFSNGCPSVSSFLADALELLQVLTHPHFIMHPLGLNPSIERTFLYTIHASAGGGVNLVTAHKKVSRKRRKGSLSSMSPNSRSAIVFSKQLYEQNNFPDIEERIESWREKRRMSLMTFPSGTSLSSCSGNVSRSSSFNNLLSENDSTTDDSQREYTASDCESELDFQENGYVTNCEYFISNSHTYDSVEEQHSLQASIADNWMVSTKSVAQRIPVFYDVDDNNWYFQSELAKPSQNSPGENEQAFKIMKFSVEAPLNSRVQSLHLQVPTQKNAPTTPNVILPSMYNSFTNSVVEAIPSALALYRLICLFELNCSMYKCMNEACIWRISMLHKRTGGIVHFTDYNGNFQVYVSVEEMYQLIGGSEKGDAKTENDVMFNLSEFRACVTQLLDLLMSENFSHPYGTVAGAVA
ncbi:uncharacterized protein LOC130629255 [Hydractinia symbiolongicarpus]|uniref:uncharacterized protein LOC130629255 n=1 Tax=Hydractinia symbiolongicarpus TaxID=13093 RepID=UPI00254FC461|nr:uncharacterized protein LOC130629255 [Hydractinia symbiolongicarpus]